MLSPNAVLHIERTNDQLNSWHFSAGLEVAGRSHMSENSSLSSLNNGGCILRLESLILKVVASISSSTHPHPVRRENPHAK